MGKRRTSRKRNDPRTPDETRNVRRIFDEIYNPQHSLDEVREEFINNLTTMKPSRHFARRIQKHIRREKAFPSGYERYVEHMVLSDKYRRWTPPQPFREDSIEILAPALLRPAKAADIGRGRNLVADWINGLLHLALYVDRVWVPDPAEILEYHLLVGADPLLTHWPLINFPRRAHEASLALKPLKPLFDLGVLTYYPPRRAYEKWVGRELFGENRWFSRKEVDTGWPELYVAEGLIYADAFSASYTALHQEEILALARTQGTARSLPAVDQKLIAALPRLTLPRFKGLTPETLVSVRCHEETFDDYRSWLRKLSTQIVSGPDERGFNPELVRFEKEDLTPALKELYQRATGIAGLRQHLGDAAIDFSAGTRASASKFAVKMRLWHLLGSSTPAQGTIWKLHQEVDRRPV